MRKAEAKQYGSLYIGDRRGKRQVICRFRVLGLQDLWIVVS